MKITKRQLRRIIREASRLRRARPQRSDSYQQGYNDAYRGPGFRRRTDDVEYRKGYEEGRADLEAGQPPSKDLEPVRRRRR